MRLFVAAEIDEAVRRAASGVQARLRAAGDADAPRAIAWVAPANLHFTLQFIGEVDRPTSALIVERLAEPIGVPPIELAVGGAGTFPASGPPRVVWLGVERGGDDLAAVAREVHRRLADLGLALDDRPFRAHLTLGRVKGTVGSRFREALAASRTVTVGRCRIDRVTLFESTLSPRGSIYAVVARTALGYHLPS